MIIFPDKSSSYDKDNNNYYDDSYYPPNKPKKLTCPDSGIVVDKAENCPLVCPAGTDLAGHLVGRRLIVKKICDEDAAAQFETCGAGTDLAGVLVTNEPEDCNIFATCDANDPLGQALGLTGTETVEVADEQLCRLGTASGTNLIQCPTDSNLGGNALVTNIALGNVATEANLCPTTSGIDLPGVYVDDQTTQCNIFATCDATDPLGISLGLTTGQTVEVADEQLCQLEVPQLDQCGPTDNNIPNALVTDLRLCNVATEANLCPTTSGIDLPGVYVDDPTTQCNIFATGQTVEVADEQLCQLDVPGVTMCEEGSNLGEGAIVTDEALCNAATPAVQCEEGSDLEGIWVNPAETASCNLSPTDITTNFGAQCLKCADLAALQGTNVNVGGPPGQNAQLQASADLIGADANAASVFTICD